MLMFEKIYCTKSNLMVSIIIPAYNAYKYLNVCVEGVLAQKYREYELLLIDDGSTDDCSVMCDQFAALDSRILVIHQENGGVSKARNRGIDVSRGKYIVFVDADDQIRPHYILDLINTGERINADYDSVFVVADYQPFSEKGMEKRVFPRPFSMDFTTNHGMTTEHFRELIFHFRLFPPYCKLYRRDIIEKNRIRFCEELKSAEDFDFNMNYLSSVNRVEYIDSVQYDYRIGYKKYIPSNYGVLGHSEIRSAHIMVNGISDLAKRMGIMTEVTPEIDLWAAKKHYFNRLRMLFRKSERVSIQERRQLYKILISNPVYYSAARRGAKQLPKSTTKMIACYLDYFPVWWRFYRRKRDI